jgi:hypothetical protein
MPLDFYNTPALAEIPEHLDFAVGYEPTKMEGKRYVRNERTGDYIGIVGRKFNCENHTKFFGDIQESIVENLTPTELEGAKVVWKSANNNAWALMDITLPNVKTVIETDKHSTELQQRMISMHGLDGTCSNQVFFGAIDFFCTNGCITGEHDKILKKNTTNFDMDTFIRELNQSKNDFYAQSEKLQGWARASLATVDVKALLETIMKSDRKAQKMYSLYNQEVSNRGRNVFALYSAFTNYATYADERNGFQLRNTGNDTQAQTMLKREQEVAKWISQPAFKELVAA